MEHLNRTGARAWLSLLSTPAAFYPAILLGLQIVLALALTWLARGTLDPAATDTRLLPFDPKAVTSLQIEGAGESVTLTRGERDGTQTWLIADLSDFPAEAAKVKALLERLAGLKRPNPVATSAAALKRHQVADDAFERKVTLKAGDQTLATLLLGDSPGFKRQFARPAGDPAVYDLDLPLFEVGNRRDDWLRPDLLRLDQTLDQTRITGVTAADWTLTKGTDGWQLTGTTDKPDPATVTNLLGRIGSLGYRGVLGTEDKPEYNQAAPTLDLRLTLADGSNRTYRISQAKDSKDFVLKTSDQPWYFKLSAFDLEGLSDLSRDRLLGRAPTAVPTAADAQETGEAAPGEGQGEGAEQAPPRTEAEDEDADPADTADEGAGPPEAAPDQAPAPSQPGER